MQVSCRNIDSPSVKLNFLTGEKNSPSVAHVGCDIFPLSRVKLKNFKHSPDGLWLKNLI
jgi:hypothetical protein